MFIITVIYCNHIYTYLSLKLKWKGDKEEFGRIFISKLFFLGFNYSGNIPLFNKRSKINTNILFFNSRKRIG